jgi:hypothetical protein
LVGPTTVDQIDIFGLTRWQPFKGDPDGEGTKTWQPRGSQAEGPQGSGLSGRVVLPQQGIADPAPIAEEEVGQGGMPARSTETTVTFRHPFFLAEIGSQQPAGEYRIVIDEDEIQGLSFLAFQRIATLLHMPAIGSRKGPDQVVAVDHHALARALERDGSA